MRIEGTIMTIQADEPIKNTDNIQDDPYDDFMCIMRADGSTLASSRGVVVTATPLVKTPKKTPCGQQD
jgi:hypothetical protein